jgi:hypothetical protein
MLNGIHIRTAYKDTKLNSMGGNRIELTNVGLPKNYEDTISWHNSYKIVLIRTCRDVTRDTALSKMCKLSLICSCLFIN